MTDSKLPLAEEFKLAARRWRDYGSPDKAEKYEAVSALLRQQHEALKAWEAWEAEWILNGNWDHGHVLMRDADMEALTPIQELRNQAIAAAKGDQS